jgi:hypothetical protein
MPSGVLAAGIGTTPEARMSKNQNLARESDGLTQNQNNAISDDPHDGGRNTFKPEASRDAPPGAIPDEQGPDRLAELGRRGSKQD